MGLKEIKENPRELPSPLSTLREYSEKSLVCKLEEGPHLIILTILGP